MTSSYLALFEILHPFFSNMNFWAFPTRILIYRRKTPYESRCVVFKDRINAINVTSSMYYVSVIEIFLEKCIKAMFNKQLT